MRIARAKHLRPLAASEPGGPIDPSPPAARETWKHSRSLKKMSCATRPGCMRCW